MTSPRKLPMPRPQTEVIHIDVSPSPENGTAPKAPNQLRQQKRQQQRRQKNAPPSNNHKTTASSNPNRGAYITSYKKENDENARTNLSCGTALPPTKNNDDKGVWIKVGRNGKGLRHDPPQQLSASIFSSNGISKENAAIFNKFRKEFEHFTIISDQLLHQTLHQNNYDETTTRGVLLELSLSDDNNGKGSRVLSSNTIDLSTSSSPDSLPKSQKAKRKKAKRKPRSQPSQPASARLPTLGDFLQPTQMQMLRREPKERRSRTTEDRAVARGSSLHRPTSKSSSSSSSGLEERPNSGNPAPYKSRKTSSVRKDASNTDDCELDRAIAIADDEKEAIFGKFRRKYTLISDHVLRQILSTFNYDDDISQYICDNHGVESSHQLNYDEAMREYNELRKHLRNLPCYRANRRRIYCNHLIDILHPSKLPKDLWNIFTQAQGKCPTPNWRRDATNLDGPCSILAGGTMEACSSVQTAIAFSNSLPNAAFDYGNGTHFAPESVNGTNCLNFLVNNYIDDCPLSTHDGEPHEDGVITRRHCPKPGPQEIEDTVKIMHIQIRYILRLGYAVLYVNIGGSAVKGIMMKVLKSLQRDKSIPAFKLKLLCVIDTNNHMYRASYCSKSWAIDTIAGLRELEKYTTTVTTAVLKVCRQIETFYDQVNCLRSNLSLCPIVRSNDLGQLLVQDLTVPYIATQHNAESWTHMQSTYIAQLSARGKLGYDNGLGQASSEQRSEWRKLGILEIGKASSEQRSEWGKLGYDNFLGQASSKQLSTWSRKSHGIDADAIESLEDKVRNASNTAEILRAKVEAISAVCEIKKIRDDPAITWHPGDHSQVSTPNDSDCFKTRMDYLERAQCLWEGASSILYLFVQPKSARVNLHQAVVAITTVMGSDPAFKTLKWNEIEKLLMELLGGTKSKMIKRRWIQETHTVDDQTIKLNINEVTTLELFEKYANKHKAGGGKSIALPSQLSEDGILYTFVKSKSRGLNSKKDSSKAKARYLLKLIEDLGFDLGNYKPE